MLLYLFFNRFGFTVLAIPLLYASLISWLVSIASHPSIDLPMLLGKNPDGTFPILSTIMFSPYLYFARAFSLVRRFLSGEEPYSQICEGLYVGGWPASPRLLPPGNPAIIDCTTEFPRIEELKGHSYLCVPTWDTRAPQPEQIESAVKWACRKRARNQPVYVHCAYGMFWKLNQRCLFSFVAAQFACFNMEFCFLITSKWTVIIVFYLKKVRVCLGESGSMWLHTSIKA